MNDQNLGLSELLKQLRQDLLDAEANVPEGKGLLKVKNVELDLSVVTEKEGDGGIKVWVVSLNGKFDEKRTNGIKLTLEPTENISPAVALK